MTEEEKYLYENIVHGLRSRGWSRIEAEDAALERIEVLREEAKRVKP